MSKNGAQSRPLSFEYSSCTYFESKYHQFVGEKSCGRWEIGQNRHFLWGQHFWWLCDCASIKEILEHKFSIPMTCRWDQELRGNHFSIVHQSNKMTTDGNALISRFGKFISQYCIIDSILYSTDKQRILKAYEESVLTKDNIVKIILDI